MNSRQTHVLTLLFLSISQLTSADVTISADGAYLIGTVEVSAPMEETLALVRDPIAIARASDSDLYLTPSDTSGECQNYQFALPSIKGVLSGTLRACGTETGVAVTLVESPDFERFDYTYEVAPSASGGALVTYRLDVSSTLPVPDMLMRRLSEREVRAALVQLSQW